MLSSNCCFFTCTQISQEAGKVVWYSHVLKNFPQFIVIHTVKGFWVVSEAEVDVFLEFLCFFYDSMDVGSLISGSYAFSKSSLYIWKFLVHILLKPSLKDFEHYLASVWDEPSCMVVWTFFGMAFELVANVWNMKHSLHTHTHTHTQPHKQHLRCLASPGACKDIAAALCRPSPEAKLIESSSFPFSPSLTPIQPSLPTSSCLKPARLFMLSAWYL